MRQVLGAIAQFEKASLIAKLKGARDRIRRRDGKCEGRKSLAERNPELVAMARKLAEPKNARGERELSLRGIAAKLAAADYVTPSGEPYSASAVASMLGIGLGRYRN